MSHIKKLSKQNIRSSRESEKVLSETEMELALRYQFGYMEADLNRLRNEAKQSILTYKDILGMELSDLKLRALNGTRKGLQ